MHTFNISILFKSHKTYLSEFTGEEMEPPRL